MQVKEYVYVPELTNPTLAPAVSGWGVTRNFTVDARDHFGRNVTVFAWDRVLAGTYEIIANDTCINCNSSITMNFTQEYFCGDIGTWEYQFNATTEDGVRTLYGSTYILQKDVAIAFNITPVYNLTVNRNISTNFTLLINDTENGTAAFDLVTGGIDAGKGTVTFTTFATNPLGFAKLKEVGITTIWPNVFTTVAEQNPASLNNVINQVGLGEFFFFLIALMGITLTLTRKERCGRMNGEAGSRFSNCLRFLDTVRCVLSIKWITE